MRRMFPYRDTFGSCNECIHVLGRFIAAGECKAFPKGIPKEILYNSHSHTEVLPEQEGDFVFEMNERYKKIYKRKEQYEKETEEKRKAEQEQLEKQLSYKIYKFIKKLFGRN